MKTDRGAAMKISVVIPVYNVAAYLEACVHSVQEQTWRDIEIVLVDDGSTDGSGAMCDALAAQDARIKVIHQSNQGLSMARNNGLEISTGDYVVFLDSDDYWQRPSALTEMQALLQGPRPPEVVLFGYCKKNLRTGAVRNLRLDPLPARPIEEQKWRLLRKRQYNNSSCTKLYRRDWLMAGKFLFPRGRKSEDLIWGREILTAVQSMAVYTQPLIVYQTGRRGSITETFGPKNYRDILEQIRQDCNDLERQPPEVRRLGRAYWAEQICWILGYLPLSGKPLEDTILECDLYFQLLPEGVCFRTRLVSLLCRILGKSLTVRLLNAYLRK